MSRKPNKIPVKRVSKSEKKDIEESDIGKFLKVITKSYNGCDYKIFETIPDEYKVGKWTDKGIPVCVARYPIFHKLYFYSYHEPGEQYYPHGGIGVLSEIEGRVQYFHFDSVALHPTRKEIKRLTDLID